MVSTIKITILLFMLLFITLIQAKFSDVPPPPQRPERFHSKEELKKYLQKVHEYHSIIGRWRLRRSIDDENNNQLFLTNSNDADLFRFFDINNDHIISQSEFAQRLKLKDRNN